MNSVQEKYFELLCEIDDLCASLHIPYWFTGRSALYAYALGELPDAAYYPSVMIRVEDAQAFREKMLETMADNRTLECMLDDADYPSFTMKYSNDDTLCIDTGEYRSYRSYGIYVIIEFVEHRPGRINWLIGQAVKWGWLENSLPYTRNNSLDTKTQLSRMIMKPAALVNREVSAKITFDQLTKMYSKPSEKYQTSRHNLQRYNLEPAWVDKAPYPVEIGGRKFPLVSNPNAYLRLLYGARYQEAAEKPQDKGAGRIIDPCVPYKEFIEDAGDLLDDRFMAALDENNRFNKENNVFLATMADQWRKALWVGTKMNLAESWVIDGVKLRNLCRSGAYDEAYEELEPYIRHARSADSEHAPFYNEQLYDTCETVLEGLERQGELIGLRSSRESAVSRFKS